MKDVSYSSMQLGRERRTAESVLPLVMEREIQDAYFHAGLYAMVEVIVGCSLDI